MIVTKKDSIPWSLALLAGSLWMIYLTYNGVSDTGLYFQILYLVPILVLLFPPIRHDIIGYIGFFLGPRTSMVLAFIIFWLVKIANRAIGTRPEPAAGPTEEVLLLREIRDALRHKD